MSSKAVPEPAGSFDIEPAAAPDATRLPLDPVSPDEYRSACARFASGVTVVTCVDAEDRPHGMTATAFTSISLDPPLVLVSIDLRHAILGHFLACRRFAVNILAEGQEPLSHRFSSVSENRFKDVDWHSGESGMPLLAGVLAQFECAAVQHIEIGDHAVLIGEVRRANYREGKPLVYFNRSYRALSREDAGGAGRPLASAADEIERDSE